MTGAADRLLGWRNLVEAREQSLQDEPKTRQTATAPAEPGEAGLQLAASASSLEEIFTKRLLLTSVK